MPTNAEKTEQLKTGRVNRKIFAGLKYRLQIIELLVPWLLSTFFQGINSNRILTKDAILDPPQGSGLSTTIAIYKATDKQFSCCLEKLQEIWLTWSSLSCDKYTTDTTIMPIYGSFY